MSLSRPTYRCLQVVIFAVLSPVALCYKEGDIVLLGGSRPSQGTVSIYWKGRWGTLCDEGWDQDKTATVCQQLGFNWTNALPATNGFFGRSKNMKPHKVYFYCPRVKTKLKYCRKSYRHQECDGDNVAGLDCEPDLEYNETAIQVRLVNAITPNAGAIEILYQGTWGAVCDSSFHPNYWGHSAAQWACKKLGFSGEGTPMSLPLTNMFPLGERKVWHEFVACQDEFTSFSQCIKRPWGNAICKDKRMVGVICDPEEASYNLTVFKSSELQFRLVNGPDERTGRVELYIYGIWGSIEALGTYSSQLICRKLGYPWGGVYHPKNTSLELDSWDFDGYLWSADIDCKGQATRFEDCLMSMWDRKYVWNTNRAWVRCLTSPHAAPPVVATTSTDLKEGERIELTCASGKGNMEVPPDLYWRCKVQSCEQCESHQQVVIGDTAFRNRTIVADKYLNGQLCRCSAHHNSGWMLDSYLNFTVAYTPTKPEVTLSSPVREKYPATVTCNVTQINPLPKIYWYQGSDLLTNINTTSNITRDYTGGFNVIEKYTFTAKRWHSGKRISCVVYNQRDGKIIRKGVVPDVHFSPILEVKVRPENVTVGGKVEFTCTVQANPGTEAFWRRDTGDIVSPLSNFTLTDVRPSDSGTYVCIANGKYFETSKAFAKIHVTDG
ncbi:deleted in malignant brain tumors 1 protein-like [Liolophura sinensis]|uniref:deleted in malignant brain tumors 1 protein-like n=1 Tax=Liolophura sinensis TaxID=3198878 RepID=UPI0031588A63